MRQFRPFRLSGRAGSVENNGGIVGVGVNRIEIRRLIFDKFSKNFGFGKRIFGVGIYQNKLLARCCFRKPAKPNSPVGKSAVP